MKKNDDWFNSQIADTKAKLADTSEDKFDNKTDFIFTKASLEGATQGFQNALVEFRKFESESSEVEATIMMHEFCKKLSDKHRIELGKIEALTNQEEEGIVRDRGRLNGLIDSYNQVRVYHDMLTSEHAAIHQRSTAAKKK